MSSYLAHNGKVVITFYSQDRLFQSNGKNPGLYGNPRKEPENAADLERFGRHVAAVREATAGLAASMEIDWAHWEIRATCAVPRHLGQTDFCDAIGLRLGVIERRMGLAPADARAEEFAAEKLPKLLPPPTER